MGDPFEKLYGLTSKTVYELALTHVELGLDSLFEDSSPHNAITMEQLQYLLRRLRLGEGLR